jgi:hypothetical protein
MSTTSTTRTGVPPVVVIVENACFVGQRSIGKDNEPRKEKMSNQPIYVTPDEVSALIKMTQDNMEEVPSTMLGIYNDRPFVIEDWAIEAVQAMRGR